MVTTRNEIAKLEAVRLQWLELGRRWDTPQRSSPEFIVRKPKYRP